jgi:hypothetical protein
VGMQTPASWISTTLTQPKRISPRIGDIRPQSGCLYGLRKWTICSYFARIAIELRRTKRIGEQGTSSRIEQPAPCAEQLSLLGAAE